MSIQITTDNYLEFSSTNEQLLCGEIKGMVLEFPGLDGNSCFGGSYGTSISDSDYAHRLAAAGILHIYMFVGPWSFMNDGAIKMTNAVIDAVRLKFSIAESVPLVMTGGSMGGYGALMYTMMGKYKPVACATSCPICDLHKFLGVYNYWSASVYHAFEPYEGGRDYLTERSPLFRTEDMPKVNYYMIVCEMDHALPAEVHAIPFCEKMRALGHRIICDRLPNKDHCVHTPEAYDAFVAFVIDSING